MIQIAKTYGALVFTLFLVWVGVGVLIRWVTGSVWASNIGGLVGVVLYLWVGRRLWRERQGDES
jgi:membrane associated rhomboid family serine protease